jgi:hypothetical protein
MAVQIKKYSRGVHSTESPQGTLIEIETVKKIFDDLTDDDDTEVIRGKIVYYLTQLEATE